ncbi:phosphoglucomutase/phosphomannomutase family protein [Brevibacillus fluminis]|uniref:Phosphoglucomutase n=1 Tax=Brevibacillus fluminis TaxID=511487 RepID=A0A3M8DSP7_9BACL|nr:phosphoglucomutase/phosphomannomutase family protein [Brevibacillus fluminis]RNB91178.1 phosphoglucomutase/phosphomannomutase family protein [Brevibacillus fluminis]
MSDIRFGTDGWRAVIADQFTMENVRIVAQAIAHYTIENQQQQQGIIVGHDTRFMGRAFAQEVASVLAANGITAYLVNEPTPTPVVAFGVRHFAASGAVMITASHNPPHYNGIKYIPDYAGPATNPITIRLEQLIHQVQQKREVNRISLEEAASKRKLQYIYLRPHYEAHLRRMIRFDVLRGAALHIVVDAMHGAGIGYVSTILKENGLKVTTIRDYEDPMFGGELPEPNDKHLAELKEEIRHARADLGLANDGDADRFGVVAADGRYIPPNQVLALLARHLIKNRKQTGRIVRTVATTHLLDRIARQHGLDSVETPVGFKYVGTEMMAGDVLIGGEESGGCSIMGHIPEKDGILTNLLIAEMCAWEKKSITDILAELHGEYGEFFSTRLDLKTRGNSEWLNQIREKPPVQIGSYEVRGVDQKDGIKLQLDNEQWLLIRPSGTEPLVRIYCEAGSLEELGGLQETVSDWFRDLHDDE